MATTTKAVAELDGAGVASMTIARLRVTLDRDGPLQQRTVLVLESIAGLRIGTWPWPNVEA